MIQFEAPMDDRTAARLNAPTEVDAPMNDAALIDAELIELDDSHIKFELAELPQGPMVIDLVTSSSSDADDEMPPLEASSISVPPLVRVAAPHSEDAIDMDTGILSVCFCTLFFIT